MDKFEQKLIIRKCLAQPKFNSTQLFASLELSQKVSTSYVRKLLLRNSSNAKVCTSNPFLSRVSRFKRYVWAKDMSRKSDHFWKHVRFSDETMIELFRKRKIFVRLPKQSRSLRKCKGQHGKFGGKKMMFWDFIEESGERKLIKVENRVN